MQQLFLCHLHHLHYCALTKLNIATFPIFWQIEKSDDWGVVQAGYLATNSAKECLDCTREFAQELTQCLQKILIIRKHRDAQFYEYVSFHSTSKDDICHICSNGVFFCTERIFSEFGWDKADLKNVIFCLYISRYPSAIY